jgi:sugar lactone lactonase YvrE
MKRVSALCFALAAGLALDAYAAAPAEIAIPGERVFPESLTSTTDGAVIIGSIGAKTIFRAKPGSRNAAAWIQPGTDGMQSIFGVYADNESNTLYACSGSFGPPKPGEARSPSALYTFDLETGAPKGHYPLPTEGASCNDIAVGTDGTAYATDTPNMQVVRLKKGAKALEVWAGSGGELGPKGGVLDGIAVLGDRVIVNVLLTSKLFSVPIGTNGKAGTVSEIRLEGSLTRPDGMRSFGKSSLLVAEAGSGGGRLSRVDLTGDSGKVSTVKDGFPGGPVAVTVAGDTAYLLEGQLGVLFRGDPNAKTEPFHAVAVPLGKP